jgi:hypothetical protein
VHRRRRRAPHGSRVEILVGRAENLPTADEDKARALNARCDGTTTTTARDADPRARDPSDIASTRARERATTKPGDGGRAVARVKCARATARAAPPAHLARGLAGRPQPHQILRSGRRSDGRSAGFSLIGGLDRDGGFNTELSWQTLPAEFGGTAAGKHILLTSNAGDPSPRAPRDHTTARTCVDSRFHEREKTCARSDQGKPATRAPLSLRISRNSVLRAGSPIGRLQAV